LLPLDRNKNKKVRSSRVRGGRRLTISLEKIGGDENDESVGPGKRKMALTIKATNVLSIIKG